MPVHAPPPPEVDDETDEPTSITNAEPGFGGRRIAGRYEVLHTIAHGGMAEVLLARHVDLGRFVAVKVIKRDRPESEGVDFEARFRAEGRVLASFDHPHIVTLYDFGLLNDGRCFLAMEYVEGPTLAAVLKQDGPMGAERVVRLALQIASALRYAHQRGVVHRDLTPSNVLLKRGDDGQDVVKLVDFGIAQVGRPEAGAAAEVVLGSPHCMAPEQIDGVGVDARTDLYALGVVMCRLLTGRWPFGGKNTMEILIGHLEHPVPTFAALSPDVRVAPALEAVVQRCLCKRQDDRFAHVDAFVEALVAAMALDPGTQAITIPTLALRRPAAEGRALPWLPITVAAALGLAALGGWWASSAPDAVAVQEDAVPAALAMPAQPPVVAEVVPEPAKATEDVRAPVAPAKVSTKSTAKPASAKPAPAKAEPAAPSRSSRSSSASAPKGYQGVPDDF